MFITITHFLLGVIFRSSKFGLQQSRLRVDLHFLEFLKMIKKYCLTILTVWSISLIALPKAVPSNSTQLIVVTVNSPTSIHAHLRRFQKRKDHWKKIGNTFPIVIGKHGATRNKHEGDLKTPLGVFPINTAFGIDQQGNTLTTMPYIQVTPSTVCVDDPQSLFYNQIINTDKIPAINWHSAEQMFQAKTAYQLGLEIAYNKRPIRPGHGSCIFMHVWQDASHGTAGCVAMTKTHLKTILAWLKPKSHPIIDIKMHH